MRTITLLIVFGLNVMLCGFIVLFSCLWVKQVVKSIHVLGGSYWYIVLLEDREWLRRRERKTRRRDGRKDRKKQ